MQNRWYNQTNAGENLDPFRRIGNNVMDENLYFHLKFQMRFEELYDNKVAWAVNQLIQRLDKNGWFDESVAELASCLNIEETIVDQAIQVIQGLEPAGVGARDLSECLLIQLERQDASDLAMTIAEHYLLPLSKGHYHFIAKETGASRAEVNAACALIRTLNPRPAAGFSKEEKLDYISPDLIVTNDEDHIALHFNDTFLPPLRLNDYYSCLYQETDDIEVKSYLGNKLRQAAWLIQCTEQRQSTLMNCAQCIVDHQESFFRYGPGHLIPLTQTDVAVKLEIHESTVSRAVRDKFLQCKYGMFPLEYFFVHSLGGTEHTADKVKELLCVFVDAEDKKHPLSDQRLTNLLKHEGIVVSRRVVSKYRGQLGIPSTAERRKI